MSEYRARSLKEGQGVLFTNHDKVDDRSPDLKGEIFVSGEIMRCGGWIKQTPNGMLVSIGIDKYNRSKNNG